MDRLTIYLLNWKCPFGAGDVILTVYQIGNVPDRRAYFCLTIAYGNICGS
jgi:hypothetical protein